ncbi:MAG: hypothetical protein IKY82_02260 [Alistipes sp.]|nr:hypothetical protein [Alistipes sp.]
MSSPLSAQNYGNGLPATDALGRKLPDADEVGAPRKDKFVGLFYWTWHTNFSNLEATIPSRIIEKHPDAAYNYEHPAWDNTPHTFFWGEPLFGFYRDTDKWVLRKHAEMLADAGVDVLFFDCTNGNYTWRESYQALCETFAEARRDGINTPQIAFMLAFGPTEGSREAIVSIYKDLYKPAKYEELFFKWQGKPLIMAYPEMLIDVEGDAEATALHREIRNYFTFRPGQPVYNKGPQREDHWGWLEVYPQHGFVKKQSGGFEQVTVGVSQNWTAHQGLSAMNTKGAFGRSYTDAKGHNYTEDVVNQGLNFQEQWDRALAIDPDFIFITGWNEWIMGRFEEWSNQKNAFPDQFDQEHSRDIEPMRGGHGDNYYYQMIANIRRFKGMPSTLSAPAEAVKRMKVDGRFEEWQPIAGYDATRGNTLHRNSDGWKGLHYQNTSGRNDIVSTKVAHDKSNIYFYVACAEPITPSTDRAWMRLYIDVDRKRETGWEGYDYVINRINPSAESAVVERSVDGGIWQRIGNIKYSVVENEMELAIPLEMFGLTNGVEFALEFKWSDNTQTEGDVYEFYLNGDSAPQGRFNYVYRAK